MEDYTEITSGSKCCKKLLYNRMALALAETVQKLVYRSVCDLDLDLDIQKVYQKGIKVRTKDKVNLYRP